MKNSQYKKGLGWAAVTFILVHFSFILIYALPPEFSSESLRKITIPYVEPIFTQKWAMFAPCPTLNGEVEIKYYFEDDSTNWVDPTESAEFFHSWLKGTHHGELVLAESNLVFWFSLDINLLNLKFDEPFPLEKKSQFNKGWSYFKIKSYILGMAYYSYDRAPISAKIRFYLEDHATGEKGLLELPEYHYP